MYFELCRQVPTYCLPSKDFGSIILQGYCFLSDNVKLVSTIAYTVDTIKNNRWWLHRKHT